MKIDIEAMAREAGFGNVVSMPHLKGFEAFARLIVERCAVEARDALTRGRSPHGPWVADAIRKLTED